MAIEERIRFFRKMRGMTQKYLGMLMGFPERSADVRMAQYETGSRTPKADLTRALAAAFEVSPSALTIPDIDTDTGDTPTRKWKPSAPKPPLTPCGKKKPNRQQKALTDTPIGKGFLIWTCCQRVARENHSGPACHLHGRMFDPPGSVIKSLSKEGRKTYRIAY